MVMRLGLAGGRARQVEKASLSHADDPLREELEMYGGLGVNEDGSFEVLVNELVVRAGYAKLYEDMDDGRYNGRLYEAAQQAASGEEGLWGVCDG